MQAGKFFIISAPSGAGKTTLTNEALKKLKDKYQINKVITYTTRMPREKEIHGVDYHFLSEQEFLNKKKNGFFLETTKYHNNFYGSPANILDKTKRGESFIIVADRPGAKNFSKLLQKPVLIWIEPPSLIELEKRLKKRQDSDETIKERLSLVKTEIENEKKEPLFKYHLINDDFKTAVKELKDIIKLNLDLISPNTYQ